jgi:hypothetical protein
VFRTTVILTVFLALVCTGVGVTANSPDAPAVSQRPDGRLLPDAADMGTNAATPTGVTGRPYGRLPDAADLRKDDAPPIVISVDRSSTRSFDWLDALIGGLVTAGVALAVGGLLIARQHGLTPAR